MRSIGKCMRSNPLKVHRGVDFCKVLKLIRTIHHPRIGGSRSWSSRIHTSEDLQGAGCHSNPSRPSRQDTW
jgi:hypothetical protein